MSVETPQSRSLPRSMSAGFSSNPSLRNIGSDAGGTRVHLISCDLWEEITGEKVNQNCICDILDMLLVSNDPLAHQSIKYVGMAKDRTKCRQLQTEIEEGNQEFRNMVFRAISSSLLSLICDGAANFVLQKLLEYITPENKKLFLDAFQTNLLQIVDNQCGCRVVQKFIECSEKPLIDSLFLIALPSLIPLCQSLNGNRIVQLFIDALPERVPLIIQTIHPKVCDLVVDNCGCRVVQHLFTPYDAEKLKPLIREVMKDSPVLAKNQYGNYVIQNIIEEGTDQQFVEILESFKKDFYDFSTHKFASNVIEKCIKKADSDQQTQIFREIIGSDGYYHKDRIKHMIGDQFGNYVIQRIIEYGSKGQKDAIAQVLFENYQSLSHVNFARHVCQKLRNHGYNI